MPANILRNLVRLLGWTAIYVLLGSLVLWYSSATVFGQPMFGDRSDAILFDRFLKAQNFLVVGVAALVAILTIAFSPTRFARPAPAGSLGRAVRLVVRFVGWMAVWFGVVLFVFYIGNWNAFGFSLSDTVGLKEMLRDSYGMILLPAVIGAFASVALTDI